MATTRRSAAMTMDEAANSTQRPGKVAAFIPVDSNGTPTTADEEDWRMRTGNGNAMTEIPTEDFDDDEPVEQTPADRIIAMLRGVNDGDRAYLKVSRVAQGNKIEFCTDYSAADFEAGGLKMIQEQWGPGEYQLILYGTKHLPSGKDHFGIRDRTSVRIAAPLTREGAPVQASSEMPQFMQQMAQTQERLLQALENRPAPVDPMVQMTQMFSMMKLMREAMGMDQAPKKENALGDIVAAMRELREVSEEFGPQGSKPAGPMEMVKDMLPMIATAMQARQTPAPAAPVTQPHVSLPAPVQTHVPVLPATPPAESEDMKLSEIMKQKAYLATLVQMGKDGCQTDEAAKFVYDNLSDDLIDLMAQDDWFTMFSAIAGDIAPQREWFQKVRDEALAMFETDSDNQSLPPQ